MEKSLKTQLSIGILILITQSKALASEIFYAPALCSPSELTLTVTNTSADSQRAWIQTRVDQDLDEVEQVMEPHSQLKISGADFLNATQAFSIKAAEENTLFALVQCDSEPALVLGKHTSPVVAHTFSSPTQSLKIHLMNLFLQTNKIGLTAFDQQGEVVESKTITLNNSYDTQSLKWILSKPVVRLEIKGEARLHSEVLYESQNKELQSPAQVTSYSSFDVDTAKTYFLVSTHEKKPEQGFVIALDDPQKIAKAREQVAHPELEKIVVAHIELNSGNHNRAFMSSDKSPYSWSVSQVYSFSDVALIDCDGSPDLIEEHLEKKLLEGGHICFWRYRVVRELSPLEVATGLLLNP